MAQGSPDAHQIIALGRLVPLKGFDLLIDAFSQIADRHPHWNLAIVGKGPSQQDLAAHIRQLGLESRVKLPGWLPDPTSAIQASELFVLSSRYEGFPNALLEAMAAGLAVVSFDCDSGPAEIIRDGVDGLLVPTGDVAALARAMERLISDQVERRRLAGQAVEVTQRFSVEKYFRRWDAVLRGADEAEFQQIAEGTD